MNACDSLGVSSFNMNYYPERRATDVGALRNLYNESICMAYPEEIAAKLQPFSAK